MLKKLLAVSIIIGCAYIWAQEISNDAEVKKSEKIVGAQSIGDVKIEIVMPPNSPMGVHTRMNVQGYLLYNNQPVNGSVPITFSIWDAYTGGNKVWGDEVDTVYCSSGLFNYLIGGKVPINPSVFTGGTYRTLQMVINGQTMPRIIITTVGWAFSAGKSDSSALAYDADKLDGYHGGTTGANIYPRTDASGKLNSSVIPPISATYADSAGGSARIGGQTLSALDSRYVNENQTNSVTSSMIVDGTITGTDVADNSLTGADIASLSVPLGDLSQSGASTGQVPQWNGSQWVPQTVTGDGNNYTTGISFSGTSTKTLTLQRYGMSSLTASFADNVDGGNADRVDGYHAQATHSNSALSPILDANGRFYISFSGSSGTAAIYGRHTGGGASVYGLSSGGTGAGVAGQNDNSGAIGTSGNSAYGTGVYGQGGQGGVTGVSTGSNYAGVYGQGPIGGVSGYGSNSSGDRQGGLFWCNGGGYAYVGAKIGGSNYKVYGSGNVSCVMPTREGDKVLFAPECPEPYFEDFGHGKLVNGHCHIELDPLFLDCIKTDANHPMKVFVQLNDDCNGVYVKVGTTGFDVYELQNGRSNASFTYRVVANRKDTDYLRFPQAIEPQFEQPPIRDISGGEK